MAQIVTHASIVISLTLQTNQALFIALLGTKLPIEQEGEPLHAGNCLPCGFKWRDGTRHIAVWAKYGWL